MTNINAGLGDRFANQRRTELQSRHQEPIERIAKARTVHLVGLHSGGVIQSGDLERLVEKDGVRA